MINAGLASALMTQIFSKYLFDFFPRHDCPNQMSITSVRKNYLDSVKSILKYMN